MKITKKIFTVVNNICSFVNNDTTNNCKMKSILNHGGSNYYHIIEDNEESSINSIMSKFDKWGEINLYISLVCE